MINEILPYLAVASILFAIGLAVVITKKNLILMLMGVELMLNAVNINFVGFSKFDSSPANGQIFSIFIMIVAAAEVAIGLAIVLKIRKHYAQINPENVNILKD
jgi:NADH:ubiquinone oxidoreductase subunit K